MKVIFASLSVLLLSAVPGALSDETVNFRSSSSSRDMPRRIRKRVRSAERSADTKKEGRRAARKIIRSWERNTARNCAGLSDDACGSAKRCEVASSGACVSTRLEAEDEAFFLAMEEYDLESSEDYDVYSSEDYESEDSADFDEQAINFRRSSRRNRDMPRSVQRRIRSAERSADSSRDARRAVSRIISRWERNTRRNCADLDDDACGDARRCVVARSGACVSTRFEAEDEVFFLAMEQFDLESSEDYDVDSADFDEQAINFRRSSRRNRDMPRRVQRRIRSAERSAETSREARRAVSRIISRWERNTRRNCADLDDDDCGDARRCVVARSGACVSDRFEAEDEAFFLAMEENDLDFD